MTRKILAFTITLMLIASIDILAAPKNVIIMRHADRVLPNGFCLSLQGLERSAALPYYFTETLPYSSFSINHVFAAYNKKTHPYIRCKQTVQPIANYLNLPLNTDFTQEQVKEIAQEILVNPKYNNDSVLICWEHEHIRPLIIAFGGEDPGDWADNIFDQVYMLSFEGNCKPKFQKILQKLMFGDRVNLTDEPHPLPQVAVPCPKVE